MVFGFGPIILTERGLAPGAASTATSMFMFGIAMAAPLGGRVVDLVGRRDALILATLVLLAFALPVLLVVPIGWAWVVFGIVGLLVGLSPGPMVSMTGQVLPEDARSFGTGVYWSIYYLIMMSAPPFAGLVSDQVGSLDVTFWLGAGMAGICILALGVFRRVVRSA